MALSLDQFVSKLTDSGVMSDVDFAAFWETLSDKPESTEDLAKELIEHKKLTKFQTQLIHQDKADGLLLGNYLILDKIGAGGMGQVYLAEHRRMERQVALKVLPAAMSEDKQAVDRFQREVKAAAQLTHPNIVTAYDADQAGDVHFFVMEYVEGSDLAKLVKNNGPLTVNQAVESVRQVAAGLDYAHRNGVVHRDIKPANLLLDPEGTIKILDMGLARYQTSQEEEALTVSGIAMGTPDFMSPEQGINAKNSDERSDIYSLGCTLYFLLIGKKVFGGESLVEKVLAHQNEPIPSLLDVCPEATPQLDAIFQKMVAKQPEDRHQSAGDLLADLEELLDGDMPTSNGGRSVAPPLKSMAVGGTDVAATAPTILHQKEEEQAKAETLISSIHDDTMNQGRPAKIAAQTGWATRKKLMVGSGVLGAVVLLAGLIIKLSTPAGMVILEIDQPELIGAVVTIDGEKKITIKTGKGNEIIEVTPDAELHKLEVKVAGFRTFTEGFTFETGNKQTIRVRLEPVVAKDVPSARSAAGENWALEFADDSSVLTESLTFGGKHPLTLELTLRPKNNTQRFSGNLAWWRNALHLGIKPNGMLEALWVQNEGQTAVYPQPNPLVTTESTHVAVVYDASTLAVFLDGHHLKTKPVGDNRFADESVVPHFVIGSYTTAKSFVGIIDEVRISNVARYTKDFTPAKRFTTDKNTLALYHFDEGSGTVLKDSSGNGHHGKIVGAEWVRVDDELKAIGEKYVWPKDQPAPAIAPFTAEEAKQHQEAWAKHLGVEVEATNSIGMKFRVIPPGEFLMGSSEEEIAKLLEEAKKRKISGRYCKQIPDEGPQHRVTLTKPYGFAIHEVTRGQFRNFVEATGFETIAEKSDVGGWGLKNGEWVLSPEYSWKTDLGFQQTDANPAVNVANPDAVAFCKWLSQKEGVNYRLPTEAEWEFACRAGTIQNYSFGDIDSLINKYAWSGQVGGKAPHPVGSKMPNRFGLYDLHGNVSEWCKDAYRAYDKQPEFDPDIPIDHPNRPARGGHASMVFPFLLRSASRYSLHFRSSAGTMGFRIVRDFKRKSVAITDPDRKVAEWVLGLGGTIRTNQRNFKEVGRLPKEVFNITTVNIAGIQQVMDEDLARFQGLKTLRDLHLESTRVSDKGLEQLKELSNLSELFLQSTKVTDTGLKHLKGLTKLTTLDLTKTRVTVQGIADLKKTLPNCKITWDGEAEKPVEAPVPNEKTGVSGTE